jgi:hypothetical protein
MHVHAYIQIPACTYTYTFLHVVSQSIPIGGEVKLSTSGPDLTHQLTGSGFKDLGLGFGPCLYKSRA